MRSTVDKDDYNIDAVLLRLKEGCTLAWNKQAGRYFIDTGRALTGPSLSRNVVEDLEGKGALSRIGLERYALSDRS